MAIISWIYYFTHWMKHKWAVSSKRAATTRLDFRSPHFGCLMERARTPNKGSSAQFCHYPQARSGASHLTSRKGHDSLSRKRKQSRHLPTLPRNGSEGQILTGGLWKLHSSMRLQGIIIIHCYLLLPPQLNPNAVLHLCMKTDIGLEPLNDMKEFQESMKPRWARFPPLHRRKVLCKLPLLNTERKINPITTGLNS